MCVYIISHFLYLLMDIWTVSTFQLNMGIQISLLDPDLNSFGYIPGSEIVRSHGESV